MRSPYREEIEKAARKHEIDPLLVEAVIWNESAGQADAFRFEPAFYERYLRDHAEWATWEPRRISSSYGLMQLMYTTALENGYRGAPEGLFDIQTNLEFGCKFLKSLLLRYEGHVEKALAAYNGGASGPTRPIPKAYARRVTNTYARLVDTRREDKV